MTQRGTNRLSPRGEPTRRIMRQERHEDHKLRLQWLAFLVGRYTFAGLDGQDPPITFEEWKRNHRPYARACPICHVDISHKKSRTCGADYCRKKEWRQRNPEKAASIKARYRRKKRERDAKAKQASAGSGGPCGVGSDSMESEQESFGVAEHSAPR